MLDVSKTAKMAQTIQRIYYIMFKVQVEMYIFRMEKEMIKLILTTYVILCYAPKIIAPAASTL